MNCEIVLVFWALAAFGIVLWYLDGYDMGDEMRHVIGAVNSFYS